VTTDFPGGQINNNMATEGRRYVGRKNPELMSKVEIDEELADLRVAESFQISRWAGEHR
jgi:hypothetical protein